MTSLAYSVRNGDRYIALGRRDERGQPLLVAASCPAELRDEFAVPADGIELRHGPLTEELADPFMGDESNWSLDPAPVRPLTEAEREELLGGRPEYADE